MLIRRIAVENFRKLRDPAEIRGLQSGLNVIVGDNEEGKSTLLKAVQAAFFDRYSMSGDAIEAMLPFGSKVQPKLEIKFKIGKTSYSLCKGFHQSSFARLKNAKGHWENAAAEDKLEEILGFTRPGRGPAKDENRGLSGPLWVEQGRAFEPLKLNDDTKRELDEAVASEVKATTSGDDGPKLLAAVEKEYLRYYTPTTGAEKRILTHQRDLVESLQQESKNLTEKRREYDAKLEDLEEIMRGIPKLRKNFEQAQKRVEAARAKVGKIEGIERKIEAADSALRIAKAELGKAETSWQVRQDKRESLAKAKMDAKSRDRAFSTLSVRHNDAKVNLDQAKEKLKWAQRECRRAKLKVGIDKLEEAEGIAKNIAENKVFVEKIPITNADIVDLRSLQRDLNIQRARLEAMATTLLFSPRGSQSVSANGKKLEVDDPYRIAGKTLFELEGFGELEVTPGGKEEDIRSCHSSVEDLQKKLRDKLDGLGFASVEDAEEAWGTKGFLLGRIGIAEAGLNGLAPTGLDGLRSNIARLREDLPPMATGPAMPVLSVKVAEEEERDAQGKLNKAEMEFAAIQGSWNKEQGALKQLRKNLSKLQEDLNTDRQGIADAIREECAKGAKKIYRKRQEKLDKVRARLEELSPDSTREELNREERSCERLQNSLTGKERREHGLKAGLQGLGILGLKEEVDKKHRELKDACMELKRLELDASAWKLLRDTLRNAEQDERLPLTPLMERLTPYVEMVFPDAKLHLNKDSLEVDKLDRKDANEPFDSLSIGTREQIAVLVRLAMADLLRKQGKPVMLILDDPLVNSDDGRFDRMACALRRTAKHLQILILTCHETRYKSLGANTIRLMKREGGASIAELLAMPNADGIDFEPARLSGNLYKPADLS